MSTPRNKPCACGSGKKFKKCCWNPKHKTFREIMEEAHPQAEEARRRIQERETIQKRVFRHSPTAAMVLLGMAAVLSTPRRTF